MTRSWIGFVAMCVGMFMAVLDIQIVASSLPEIQSALAIPIERLSWVQTAYLIAEVIAIPLTARLTRLLTLGGLFVAAVAGFTLASTGCALSDGFAMLIAFRAVQGLCGGAVIPAVFTAVFALFAARERDRVLATTIAGAFAMLAPTLGPSVGGYITETWSWHWLFLINLVPGIAVVAAVAGSIRVGRPDWPAAARLDGIGVALAAVGLASLEILLKEGPPRDWQGGFVLGLAAVCLAAGTAFVRRCLAHRAPLVALRGFAERSYAIGCGLSFVLGMGLYGSVYLLPLFLGYVRRHSPLEIGAVMIVTGAAQLAVAPVAAVAERRIDPRLLAAFGYALFAAGLFANGFMTRETDFDGLFWPQVLRGTAVLFCLLPTTAMVLEGRGGDALADASALFNLMRNLGGAIGIALVDTVLEGRTAGHVAALIARLQAGDAAAARLVGLPPDRFHGVPIGAIDAATQAAVAPLVERAATVIAFNEAWLMLGAIFAVALAAPPFVRRGPLVPADRRW